MINLTATSESNPQTIAVWTSYSPQYPPTRYSYYWKLKCVAWISQNVNTLKTTVYYKWQIEQYNYWPFWNDAHSYSLSLDGTSNSVSFSMPQSTANNTRNMCSARALGTFSHNPSTGAYSGTFNFKGARCGGLNWSGVTIPYETFNYSEGMTLPTIAIPTPPDPDEPDPPEPEPVEPDPPTPLEFDNIPYYFIYADDQLIYGAGIAGREILNPKLVLEVNKAGSLQFDLPKSSEMYNSIDLLKSTVEARQGNEVLFRGRLLNQGRDLRNTKHKYCEGFMAWLCDISFLPYSYSGYARDLLKEYLRRYNSRASANRQITYKYSDISAKVSLEQKNASTAWDEMKSVLISGVGGYIVPYLTSEETGIQWLSSYGSSTSQVIQFAENLCDFDEYIDGSQVFTAVRAFGKEINGTRVVLSGDDGFVFNQAAIDKFGRIERTVYFDEITTESALRDAANTYLRLGLEAALTMTISAVDLHLLNVNVERIRLGDSVRVVSVPHEIDAFFLCTKIEIDMAYPQNSKFTFGSTQRTLSELSDTSYNKYVITEGA